MANTALNQKEITEYFDSDEKILKDVEELARLIKESKHCVIHTGAGISTSAGISDFRGPNGVWTLRAKGEKPIYRRVLKMPTLCHMGIKKLIDSDIVKYLVSQNTDGLHIKSGVPHNKISELHGNRNKEYCQRCKKIYFRDFSTRDAYDVHDHQTKRKCTDCGEYLYDSIINFSEPLPEKELKNATEQSKQCDLAIVLGTSMRVTPACELPMSIKKNGKLVICNLQKTPYDHLAHIVCHTQTDKLMKLLMEKLNIELPNYTFNFTLKTAVNKTENLFEIIESSVDLNLLLSNFHLHDSADKVFNLKPNYKTQITSFTNNNFLKLRFEFNLLFPFYSIIPLNKEVSTINILLNPAECKLDYEIL